MRSAMLGSILSSFPGFRAMPGDASRPDSDLLERFTQANDQQAFAALVHRHGSMVLTVCRRLLGNNHDVEDAFQATFLVLVRKAATLKRPNQLAPWLHGVAWRISLRLRHNWTRWQELPESLQPAENKSEPLDQLAWKEVRTILDEEIERLPSKYRLPMVLCYLQGQSYADAARSLGWAPGTVSVRLARGRQKLRERLVGRGLRLSVGWISGLLGREVKAAPVSAALFKATVNASCGVAGSSTVAGFGSQKVVKLAEEVMQTMWMTKFKTTLLLVLGTGLVWTGLGSLVSHQSSQAQAPMPMAGRNEEPKRPQAVGTQEQNKELIEIERRLKALQEEQLNKLRQGDALDQIEAGINKLKLANADQPQKNAAVKEFEQAFGKLKQGLKQAETGDPSSVSRQMDTIKELLEMGSAGKKTQKMQQELLDNLDEMIKELEAKQKKPEDPKLKDKIAEMKMIRSLQQKINLRTEFYGNQFKGDPVPPPETAKDPEEKEKVETLRRELKDLSNRQEKISKITKQLAQPKKDEHE